MARPELDVVTGAFSYTARAIAEELLGDALVRDAPPARGGCRQTQGAEPPLRRASFRSWVGSHGESLGRGYVSELARNFRPYDPL